MSQQPIPNIDFATVNQAYNNYLLEQNGRIIQRQDKQLANGYYRQPLDASTLTRLRQGRAVLVEAPAVHGILINGTFGSGCCPPNPGQPLPTNNAPLPG